MVDLLTSKEFYWGTRKMGKSELCSCKYKNEPQTFNFPNIAASYLDNHLKVTPPPQKKKKRKKILDRLNI